MRDKKSNPIKISRGRLYLIKGRSKGSKRKTETHSLTRSFSKTSRATRNSAKNHSASKLFNG